MGKWRGRRKGAISAAAAACARARAMATTSSGAAASMVRLTLLLAAPLLACAAAAPLTPSWPYSWRALPVWGSGQGYSPAAAWSGSVTARLKTDEEVFRGDGGKASSADIESAKLSIEALRKQMEAARAGGGSTSKWLLVKLMLQDWLHDESTLVALTSFAFLGLVIWCCGGQKRDFSLKPQVRATARAAARAAAAAACAAACAAARAAAAACAHPAAHPSPSQWRVTSGNSGPWAKKDAWVAWDPLSGGRSWTDHLHRMQLANEAFLVLNFQEVMMMVLVLVLLLVLVLPLVLTLFPLLPAQAIRVYTIVAGMCEGLSDEALSAELSDQWQSVLVLRYKTGVDVLGLFTAAAASAHKKVVEHLQQQAAACLRQGLGEREQEAEMQKFVLLMGKAFPDEDWEDPAIANIPTHGTLGLLKPAAEACFRRCFRSLAAWVREGEHSSLPALGGAELQLTSELSEGVRCKLFLDNISVLSPFLFEEHEAYLGACSVEKATAKAQEEVMRPEFWIKEKSL